MKNLKKIKIWGLLSLVLAAVGVVSIHKGANAAEYGINMSPLNQQIVLNPGESYNGSFIIANAHDNIDDFQYTVIVEPFYVDNDFDLYYNEKSAYNDLVDWITLETTEGIISPNETREIHFQIDVPDGAPAGGQYAAIMVTSVPRGEELEGGMNLQVSQAMAYLVYLEVAGTTIRSGEFVSVDVPGFMFTGNISGSSVIKNTGNVHSPAYYTLQVFPLFSDEELYTNEEEPASAVLFPERLFSKTVYWDETPKVGIFRVIFNVSYEGMETKVEKLCYIFALNCHKFLR